MIAGITVKNGRKKKSMNTDPERNLFYISHFFNKKRKNDRKS